jgi:hypothetical protein
MSGPSLELSDKGLMYADLVNGHEVEVVIDDISG